MNICLLGLDNLPVLAPELRAHAIGGESVQQTLLARALVRRGHEVSMVTADDSPLQTTVREGIRVHRAYRPAAGLPVVRFIHPRWTGLWSALGRADARIYYTSCAGMHVGLLALFCARHGRRLVFRCASDADCDPARLLIRYGRDRWLYRYGVRRADVILAQSSEQTRLLLRHFGRAAQLAGMLVDAPPAAAARDIDVLWIGNLRQVKRPDRLLALAAALPNVAIHAVGGPVPDEAQLYERVRRSAARHPNLTFHGPLPYREANTMYGRARLLVNTSDIEGFPNAYLQAWVQGVPVVAFRDPDGVIGRGALGVSVGSMRDMQATVRGLLGEPGKLAAMSARCRDYMAREYAEERVLAPYLASFDELDRDPAGTARLQAASEGHRG